HVGAAGSAAGVRGLERIAAGVEQPLFGGLVAGEPAATHADLAQRGVGGRWLTRDEAAEQGLLDARGNPLQTADTRRATRRYYMDLLGRAPSDAEYAAAAGMTADELLGQLVRSADHYETWYEDQLFFFLLLDNFRPATENLTAIPERLANGEITVRDAIHEIVISQYFNARNPGNDTYVTVILEQLLGIVVQDRKEVLERGKKMYDGYPNEIFSQKGANQSDLVYIVLQQGEFAELFLKRCYTSLLGRAPAKDALAAAALRFAKEPESFPEIEKGWLLSPEYQDGLAKPKTKNDHMFIRSLYMDLLSRKPSYQEFRSMRNALLALSDSGPIRSVLTKVIVDSEKVAAPEKEKLELAPWLKANYVRYLCREPSAEELDLFAQVLAGKGATPKTLLLAILTSKEYQSY
ncbi:MAG: hypothetical protein HZA54_06975, partial [Planctomycetes bacterium]|nr:hypothetical protein [Planctomycetota bacterium]